MKAVRIMFSEEYGEFPDRLVILIVPDDTTNKEIKEKLYEAENVMRNCCNEDFEEYGICYS